jgi:hypothetical protein
VSCFTGLLGGGGAKQDGIPPVGGDRREGGGEGRTRDNTTRKIYKGLRVHTEHNIYIYLYIETSRVIFKSEKYINNYSEDINCKQDYTKRTNYINTH